MAAASGTENPTPTPMPPQRPEHVREYEDKRQDRQNRDVAARHVRRKSHRQCERPDEHADQLHRNQQEVERRRHTVRNEVDPVLDEPVRESAGRDDRQERDRRQPGRHIEIAGRRRAAVNQMLQERIRPA